MCVTCFGLWLGHPLACQYKNLTEEDTTRICVAPCLQSLFFRMLQQKIIKV